jgi:hypothetical protein
LLYVQCLHLLVHLVQAKAAPAEPLTGLPTNSESLGSGHQGLSQRLAASIGKCAAAAIGSTSTEVQGLGVELVQALLMLHNVSMECWGQYAVEQGQVRLGVCTA